MTLTNAQILARFAPYVYLHPEEEFLPCSVDWYLQNTTLHDRHHKTVLDPVGDPSKLPHADSATHYLAIKHDATRHGLPAAGNRIQAPVYGVVHDRGSNFLEVAYWFFYAFNGNITDLNQLRAELSAAIAADAVLCLWPGVDIPFLLEAAALAYFSKVKGCGMHEADWEHITVRVKAETYEIVDVYYAQHAGGQFCTVPPAKGGQTYSVLPGSWRPIVYSAKCSHSSHPAPGTTRRLGGYANDHAAAGKVWDTVHNVVDMGDPRAAAWLDYAGDWGCKGDKISSALKKTEKGFLKKAQLSDLAEYVDAPNGPKQKASWLLGEKFPERPGSIWSDAGHWNKPEHYSTIQCADIDGDGKDELLGRGPEGLQIFKHTDHGWAQNSELPTFSDAGGWNAAHYYSSIRCADIDGDGQAEVMARSYGGIIGFHWSSELQQWQECVPVQQLFSDPQGWHYPPYASTIQYADIDGDLEEELIGRGIDGLHVYKCVAGKFELLTKIDAFSDAGGWAVPSYYSTIQCADIDGDGLAEILGRGAAGLLVYRYNKTEKRFDHDSTIEFFADAWGMGSDPAYYSTIQTGHVLTPKAANVIGRNGAGLSIFVYDKQQKTWRQEPGPQLSDQTGWHQAIYYSTIQCADVDDDGLEEIVARGYSGLVIFKRSSAPAAGGLPQWEQLEGPAWSDPNGWSNPGCYTTIHSGKIGAASFGAKSILGRSPTGICAYEFPHRVAGAIGVQAAGG